jgi:TctA family transporter
MDLLVQAFAAAFNPVSLAMLVGGVVAGLIVGAVPGIGGVFAMVLLLPLTNSIDIYAAMGLLIGLTSVGTTSDTMPAVLIGVPGSAAAIATVEDGHPLARKGQAGRALGAAYSASLIGGLVGALLLALAIPILRPIVLSLRTPDFLAVSVLGLLFVSVVSGKEAGKGLLAALLGILLAMIGLDPMAGAARLTFGSSYLWEGLAFPIVFVGLFGLVELADLVRRGSVVDATTTPGTASVLAGVRDTLREWRLVLASSWIGTLVGAIPGIGVTTIDWIAYGLASRNRRGGPPFGQGNIRGVIAPESANNAKEGGNLIPTLAIGLPGSIGMVFVLSVLSSHGIAPGPKMLTDHLPLVYAIVIFIAVANLLGTLICLVMTRPISSLANAPYAYLVSIAMVFIVFGAFSEHLSPFDIVVLLVFGALGMGMKHSGWPRAAFALGFILGPSVERYFFLSSQLTGTEWLSRPAVLVVIALLIGITAYAAIKGRLSPKVLFFETRSWGDRLVLAAMLAAAVACLVASIPLKDGAELFPRVVATLLLVAAMPATLRALTWWPPITFGADIRAPMVIIGMIVALMAGLYLVGPIPTVLLFVSGSILLIRRSGLVPAIVAAGASALVIYLIFYLAQYVSWPRPIVPLFG